MARRTRRPELHPLPGRDFTWSGTALAVQPMDPATMDAALAASGWRSYEVAVSDCVHTVWAKSRDAARRLAGKEHKATCLLA